MFEQKKNHKKIVTDIKNWHLKFPALVSKHPSQNYVALKTPSFYPKKSEFSDKGWPYYNNYFAVVLPATIDFRFEQKKNQNDREVNSPTN